MMYIRGNAEEATMTKGPIEAVKIMEENRGWCASVTKDPDTGEIIRWLIR